MGKNISLKENKKISVCYGDLCTTDEDFDLLVCSAFRRDYLASEGTLIGNLHLKKSISVEELAKHPCLDFRKSNNCWVSEELEGNLRRIACVELLDYEMRNNLEMQQTVILKEMFSSVYFLLTQMNQKGFPLKRVALPVLGSGNQGLELCYIVPPLLSQCMRALDTIPQLEEIIFYECDEGKANYIHKELTKALSASQQSKYIFISYSSAQRELADSVKTYMEAHGISCWMAPYSIPSGSSYQAEIPAAIHNTSAVVLLLSEESEKSRWVQKEVGSTIGSRHYLIPYMDHVYEHSQQFNFLLDGEQIFEAWAIDDERQRLHKLFEEILRKLQKEIPSEHKAEPDRTNENRNVKPQKIKNVDEDSILGELKVLNKTLQIGIVVVSLFKLLDLFTRLFGKKNK